jgi:spore maturation protein CgeB
VVWGVDNHVRDYAGRDYDALFMAHSWGQRMTEPNAHWLPCAYDPKWFYNMHQGERDIDVAVIGYPYAERQEIVMKMLAAGLKVRYGVGAVYDEYNAIYNRAKIALVKSINGDLAQRFFENMAQGCCVLTDYTPDAIRLGFFPYNDFWLYQTPEDAVAAAQWLIESGKWLDIAVSGEARVKPHTWDARAHQLLQVMEMSQ